MEKLKEFWKKLDPKVAIIGGIVVVSTSLGTCHLVGGEEDAAVVEEVAPVEEAPVEEAPVEEATEEA
ncbi:MAG TPA: hypothetical protein EYN66_18170 [Myxococcales bacterium]|nr:hypothetical protein [Myxococcales bacterium]